MRTSRRAVRRRLQEVGTRPTPVPRPEFVAGLESKLFGWATIGRRTPVVALSPPRERARSQRRRRRRVIPVLSAAATLVAAVVLTGALAGWFGRDTPQHHLALAAAVDTVVVMPDGSTMPGVSGLELPDGAVIRTGPNGHVTAGAVDLGPRTEGIVQAGHLILRVPPTPVPAATTATSTTPTSTAPITRPAGLPAVTLPTLPNVTLPKVTHPTHHNVPRPKVTLPTLSTH